METKEKSILAVGMFGQLQISYKDILLTEDMIHSEMVSKLFAYILLHNKRMLTVRELSDMLWGDEGGSDNPAGALKNLMYRLRTVLKKYFGEEEQFLNTSQGAYHWNSAIKVVLDTEEFESNVKEAQTASSMETKIICFERVLDLYQGRFLDNYSSEQWVVPISAYYHSLFVRVSKDLALGCQKEGLYEEMERVCARAIQYENLDEELHQLMLESLVCQKKQSKAMQYYDDTVKRFYEALGVRKLPRLMEVYEKVLAMKKVSIAASAEDITHEVQEEKAPNGAYICGYAVFREIYRIEARRVKRTGLSEYVMHITLMVKKDYVVNESVERYLLNRAMDRMEEILRDTLRIGDVVTRYSDSQFLILLPGCTYKDTEMIAGRIAKCYEDNGKSSKVNVYYYIEEVAAAEL